MLINGCKQHEFKTIWISNDDTESMQQCSNCGAIKRLYFNKVVSDRELELDKEIVKLKEELNVCKSERCSLCHYSRNGRCTCIDETFIKCLPTPIQQKWQSRWFQIEEFPEAIYVTNIKANKQLLMYKNGDISYIKYERDEDG